MLDIIHLFSKTLNLVFKCLQIQHKAEALNNTFKYILSFLLTHAHIFNELTSPCVLLKLHTTILQSYILLGTVLRNERWRGLAGNTSFIECVWITQTYKAVFLCQELFEDLSALTELDINALPHGARIWLCQVKVIIYWPNSLQWIPTDTDNRLSSDMASWNHLHAAAYSFFIINSETPNYWPTHLQNCCIFYMLDKKQTKKAWWEIKKPFLLNKN